MHTLFVVLGTIGLIVQMLGLLAPEGQKGSQLYKAQWAVLGIGSGLLLFLGSVIWLANTLSGG